jgi:two-component system, chemotaxis family, sensor kinase CheA
VVKDLGLLLSGLETFAGASVEADGSILLVLDVAGLVARARRGREVAMAEPIPPVLKVDGPTPVRSSVLVVDDAALVRQIERSILEGAGYHVRTANDGVEALARLAEAPCDLVVTDVEMPRMDGFALTAAVRADPDLVATRVLIVTSRASDESRRRGLAVDGYIVKSAFDATALLRAVSHILRRRAGPRS